MNQSSVKSNTAQVADHPANIHDGSVVNIAKGKPATQSSFSQWSAGPDEASRAVAGLMPDTYAFHTDVEDNPWWQVDLLSIYPIERIVLHNRLDACSDRAKTLKVEVSKDGEQWIVIHTGLAYFSGGHMGSPLELPLGSSVSCRYIRLSLMERQPLHLAQVEIFCRNEKFILEEFAKQHKISNESLSELLEYSLSGDITLPIIGLDVSPGTGYFGRVGNLLMQFTTAILLAEKIGLKYIRFERHEFSELDKAISIGNITFLPNDGPLPSEGAFLRGPFFHPGTSPFSPIVASLSQPDEVELSRVAREIIRPHLFNKLDLTGAIHFEDELTIHLRSGDLFTGLAEHSGYRQPPLAFYTHLIKKLVSEGAITRVRLVFEDRGNPCVDAVEEFLVERGIAFRSQSGTLAEDLAALIDAPHLAFGFGTFGYAACRLSTHIKTVHFYSPEICGSYAQIPIIDRVFEVHDEQDGYIRPFERVWFNTPEQRELMIKYPVEALGFVVQK